MGLGASRVPPPLALATPALAGSYTVDPMHSRVGFSVTHMTVSSVKGEFGTFSGSMEWDPKNVAATKAEGTVTIGSVNTREAKRDEHLKSPDFFDSIKFPEMKFVSTGVQNITPASFDLVGNLTMHGVTKPVTFKMKTPAPDAKDPYGTIKTGTTATAVIDRQAFGVSFSKALETGGLLVGNDVTIELDLELNKK